MDVKEVAEWINNADDAELTALMEELTYHAARALAAWLSEAFEDDD